MLNILSLVIRTRLLCYGVCCSLSVGWDEGCLSMQLGEVASLTIVSEKGYGKGGFPAWGYPFNNR